MMWKAKAVCVSVIVFGALLAGIPRAQAQNQQQESVAEAARRAREQKKDAAKPATVITNDTLEPAKNTAATPAPAAAEAAGAAPSTNLAVTAAPAADQQTTGSAGSSAINETSKDAEGAQAELKALKQEIAEKQLEVDLAQRELALANDDFYSRPDFSHDDTGKAKLDTMQSDLAQKQDELTQLKAKLPAGALAKEEKLAGTEAQTQAPSETQPQPEQQTQPQQP